MSALSEPPFWEQQRGTGPVTEWLLDRQWVQVLVWARRRHREEELAKEQEAAKDLSNRPPSAEALAKEREADARHAACLRNRSFGIRRVPARPRRHYHSVVESVAPDCATIMKGRSSFMLDSGLRRWAMELFGEAEQDPRRRR